MLATRRLWAFFVTMGTAAIIAGCAAESASPSQAPEQPDMLLGLPSLGFVRCQVQPYASTSVAIGPAGGVIQVRNHRLSIPAGALDRTVVITMEAPSDTIRSVRFSPEGLTFNPAHLPTLRMDYSNCSVIALLTKRIVYTDEQWNLLERLLTLDLLSLLRVEADISHFSRYAIHY